jgi:glycosyltransferase involved in cell wall biosynthesis
MPAADWGGVSVIMKECIALDAAAAVLPSCYAAAMPPDSSLRVLAFEPYDAGSHRAVRESITRHSRWTWRWITRPGRAWKWRMRLAAVELVDAAGEAGALDERPDVLFATSLMDVAGLVALLPPALRTLPVVLYMHENQAAYPTGHRTAPEAGPAADRDVQFALTNLASILAADLTIWNSDWNRRSFVEEITALLRHAPDTPLRELGRRIDERSVVIWPPVEPPPEDAVLHNREQGGIGASSGGGVRVAWPHRWEHDKGPEELLALAEAHSEALDLRWTILGQQFRETPEALEAFRSRLDARVDHLGHVEDRADYWQHLGRCDWVLSTARHEFFGVAVVEAMLAGCLPWLPDRLSYPELLPPIARGLSPMNPPDDARAVRAQLAAHLEPALAPNAVTRIDDALEGAASGQSNRSS